MKRLLLLVAVLGLGVAGLAAPASAGGTDRFPDAIPLPDGFFPEGIAIDGRVAYVGSLVDGAIQAADLATGESGTLVPGLDGGRIAVGMDVDRYGRLWVAGGGPALAPDTPPEFRVYDGRTGELLAQEPLAAGFVNDVIVTRRAAWFTDSFSPNLLRVPIADDGSIGPAEIVALSGDWVQTEGFNANGIVATPDGRALIVAQSTAPEGGTAALYGLPADLDAPTIDATRIEIDQALPSGDGLVLVGKTLYAVGGGQVTKLRLDRQSPQATIVEALDVPGAISPTTADVFGPRLYVVDAKFPFFGDPTTPFQITAIRR